MTTTRTATKGGLAVLGVAAACALACSLPLLVGAGLFASFGALATGTPWVAIALLTPTAAAGIAWWVRRRRKAASATSCDCGGGC